jgi:hypothetical protein
VPPFRAPDAPIPVAHSWRAHAINASRKGGVTDTIPFNNAAERALRGLALGRKSWLFAGSERGAERAALKYTLIQNQSSITSIRKLASPTFSPGSPTCRR